MVGGTEYWSRYPYQMYYFEVLLCILCSIETMRKTNHSLSLSIHGILLILSIGYVFYLHYQRRPALNGQFAQMIEKTPKEKQGLVLFQTFMKSFVLPSIVLGSLLYLYICY